MTEKQPERRKTKKRQAETAVRSSFLPKVKVFELLPPSQQYPVKRALFRQGAEVENLYFIETGLVKLVRSEENGSEMIVNVRNPGWLLGSAAAILGQRFPTTAVTLTPCLLRRLPVKDFHQLMKTNHDFSWYVHCVHSRDILEQTIRLSELGNLSARQRLEHLLWELISALDLRDPRQSERIQLPLKHSEIAQLIAVTPEHVSRVLKQMEAKKFVQRKKGWIIVPDPQKLYRPNDL
jgi:CRP/FNR family transcriptional regulator